MSIKKASLIIFSIILVDQILKFYIKTHFALGDSVEVTGFMRIVFVENAGMAWGSKLSDFLPFVSEPVSKVILTTFRLFAIGGIAYWLYLSLQRKRSRVLLVSICLILAGAVGNILDSLFYNLIFDRGTHFDMVSNTWVGYGGIAQANFEGYAGFMQGCVVDMVQLPLFQGNWPQWVPFLGGEQVGFFNYVFNIADASITVGVSILIIFHKRAFPKAPKQEEALEDQEESSEENT